MRSEPPDPNWPRLLGLAVHELRTPISVGSGYLRMLVSSSDGTLTDRQQQFIAESQKAWARMTTLAEEMSILSQLEAGSYRLDRQANDLRRVLAEAIEAMPPSADAPVDVRLTGDDVSAPVEADGARLRGALTAVLVALRREVVTSTELFVQHSAREHLGKPAFWIAIGEAEHVGALAAAGADSLATFDEWRGGSGLKLAIARRVVNGHDGSMWSPADGTKAGAVIVLPRSPGH